MPQLARSPWDRKLRLAFRAGSKDEHGVPAESVGGNNELEREQNRARCGVQPAVMTAADGVEKMGVGTSKKQTGPEGLINCEVRRSYALERS